MSARDGYQPGVPEQVPGPHPDLVATGQVGHSDGIRIHRIG
jgi:hypothetical protein